uniref:Uncharacterized protein n=1 Tax=Anopheles quadriannulatus TaxID=34691 RepID=A0A182XRW0_ANOQN
MSSYDSKMRSAEAVRCAGASSPEDSSENKARRFRLKHSCSNLTLTNCQNDTARR